MEYPQQRLVKSSKAWHKNLKQDLWCCEVRYFGITTVCWWDADDCLVERYALSWGGLRLSSGWGSREHCILRKTVIPATCLRCLRDWIPSASWRFSERIEMALFWRLSKILSIIGISHFFDYAKNVPLFMSMWTTTSRITDTSVNKPMKKWTTSSRIN